jgi:hypothetical protein
MECFTCHQINANGSKFCSNCGKSFFGKPVWKGAQQESYPNAEAIKQLAEVQAGRIQK